MSEAPIRSGPPLFTVTTTRQVRLGPRDAERRAEVGLLGRRGAAERVVAGGGGRRPVAPQERDARDRGRRPGVEEHQVRPETARGGRRGGDVGQPRRLAGRDRLARPLRGNRETEGPGDPGGAPGVRDERAGDDRDGVVGVDPDAAGRDAERRGLPANVVPRTSSIATVSPGPTVTRTFGARAVVAGRRERLVDRALGEVGEVDVRSLGEGVRDPERADELLSAAPVAFAVARIHCVVAGGSAGAGPRRRRRARPAR